MKNIKRIFMCFAYALLCSASSCEKSPFVEGVYSIKIQNNSITHIAFLVSYDYPDTIIPNQYGSLSGIKAGDFTPIDSKKKWDDVFVEKHASKISFFFFDPDTVTKYGWNTVRNAYKILKRKDFALQELKDCNYNVTYP